MCSFIYSVVQESLDEQVPLGTNNQWLYLLKMVSWWCMWKYSSDKRGFFRKALQLISSNWEQLGKLTSFLNMWYESTKMWYKKTEFNNWYTRLFVSHTHINVKEAVFQMHSLHWHLMCSHSPLFTTFKTRHWHLNPWCVCLCRCFCLSWWSCCSRQKNLIWDLESLNWNATSILRKW